MPSLKDRTVAFFRRIILTFNRGLPDFFRKVLRIDRENQGPRDNNLRVVEGFTDGAFHDNIAAPALGRDHIRTCSSTAVETGNLRDTFLMIRILYVS